MPARPNPRFQSLFSGRRKSVGVHPKKQSPGSRSPGYNRIPPEKTTAPAFTRFIRTAAPIRKTRCWRGTGITSGIGKVDRIGFNEQSWLDQESHPHLERLHVIERYTRPDLGHLETEITVEDPAILAR